MTTAGSGADDDAEKSVIVRPSLSFRKRHNNLLDELHAARYASRSEAARAAIESHAKSVLDDGETGVELISKQIKQLEVQVNELTDQIDEIQQQSSVNNTTDSSSQLGNDTDSNKNNPAVESTETQGSEELQDAIYALLSEYGEMSVQEIAEQVNEDSFTVRTNIEQLVENYGFVTCAKQADALRYKIKKSYSN